MRTRLQSGLQENKVWEERKKTSREKVNKAILSEKNCLTVFKHSSSIFDHSAKFSSKTEKISGIFSIVPSFVIRLQDKLINILKSVVTLCEKIFRSEKCKCHQHFAVGIGKMSK